VNDQLPMSRREFTALSLAAGIAAAAGARAADPREVRDTDVQVKTKVEFAMPHSCTRRTRLRALP